MGTTVDWSFPYQPEIYMSHRYAHRLMWPIQSFSCSPSSQVTLGCVDLTIKTNEHSRINLDQSTSLKKTLQGLWHYSCFPLQRENYSLLSCRIVIIFSLIFFFVNFTVNTFQILFTWIIKYFASCMKTIARVLMFLFSFFWEVILLFLESCLPTGSVCSHKT